MTTINVTHDQREALVVSDEVIVMNGGEIQQNARRSTPIARPSNAFVANFIGVTNFIEGKVAAVSAQVAAIDAHGMRLSGVAADSQLSVGGSCAGAVRAEQIRIAAKSNGLAGLETVVDGHVVRLHLSKANASVYEIRVPGLGDALMRVFDHDPETHLQFSPGEEVCLGWNARDMHVFQK